MGKIGENKQNVGVRRVGGQRSDRTNALPKHNKIEKSIETQVEEYKQRKIGMEKKYKADIKEEESDIQSEIEPKKMPRRIIRKRKPKKEEDKDGQMEIDS